MGNRNKRIIGRLITMALAVVLCIGMAVPAFAAGEITGTEAKPAQAAITKTMKMPEGTTAPGFTFGFKFVKKALNENTAAEDFAKMPEIPNQTIAFAQSENGPTVDGVKTVTKEKVIDLDGVTFQTAGVYTYTLTELDDIVAGSKVDGETLAYSKAEYEITFFVKEKTGGGVYVAAIGTKIMKNDDGTAGSEEKVDPTPGTGGGLGGGGLLFTNIYSKTTGGLDPKVNQALVISKVVEGEFADTGKYFTYDVKVTKPIVGASGVKYLAFILDASGAVIDPRPNNAPADATITSVTDVGIGFRINDDESMLIKLKHGEKLVLSNAQVGATYVAEEQGAADYTPKVKLMINGVELPLSASVGQPLSTGSRMIGENGNKAAFTNTHKTIPVTGLIINNLPFIMILAIAAGALVVFILVKSRKRREYAAHN